jgi:hypothetical protein
MLDAHDFMANRGSLDDPYRIQWQVTQGRAAGCGVSPDIRLLKPDGSTSGFIGAHPVPE